MKPRFVIGNLIGPSTLARSQQMGLEGYCCCLILAEETRNSTLCYRLLQPIGRFVWHTAGFIDEHFELVDTK